MCGCGKLTIKKLNNRKKKMMQKKKLAQNIQQKLEDSNNTTDNLEFKPTNRQSGFQLPNMVGQTTAQIRAFGGVGTRRIRGRRMRKNKRNQRK